jgi:hypothetical protein
VHLNYGPLDNTELLLYYGFAVPDNGYDTVGVHLEAPDEEEDPLSCVKAVLMAHCHLPEHNMLRLRGSLSFFFLFFFSPLFYPPCLMPIYLSLR